MDTIIVSILFFLSLLYSLYAAIPLLYPLFFGLGCFILIALRRGFAARDLAGMMLAGVKRSLIVLRIFVLIGAITAVWRACGTVAFIVYYGVAFMSSHLFILSAFLLSCIVSFLLGTSFGTVGTIGVVLIILAKSGGVDINAAAGAIIAGAYFGDRCSPMSSSASLVAALTNTRLYSNIKNMAVTTILPLVLAAACYGYVSSWHPLVFQDSRIVDEIRRYFDISLLTLLPAVIILAAAALKIDVKISMGISIVLGTAIAVGLQHKTLPQMAGYIVTGYALDEPGFLAGIIQGGGLSSMLNAGSIVLISSAFSGIFEGTGLLREIESYIERLCGRVGTYIATMLTSLAAAAFACNQTLAIMLTHQFIYKSYEKRRISKYRLALDLENTVVVTSAVIPWNIAGAFPAAALSADAGFILYAYYLFLVPLVNMFFPQTDTILQKEEL